MSGYLVQFLTGFAQLGIIGVTTLFEQVEILLCHFFLACVPLAGVGHLDALYVSGDLFEPPVRILNRRIAL